jgi:hypothetical protein
MVNATSVMVTQPLLVIVLAVFTLVAQILTPVIHGTNLSNKVQKSMSLFNLCSYNIHTCNGGLPPCCRSFLGEVVEFQ